MDEYFELAGLSLIAGDDPGEFVVSITESPSQQQSQLLDGLVGESTN